MLWSMKRKQEYRAKLYLCVFVFLEYSVTGEYVNFLFKGLKNKGGIIGRVAKRILNTLWGALCQRNKSYHDVADSVELFNFPEGEVLNSITPINRAPNR